MSNPLLSVQGVVRGFTTSHSTVEVLRHIDLDVYSGEILALTGASGVGKSTLLHLMGGLDAPSRGTILFKSKPLTALRDPELAQYRNESIGFVFQFHHLLPEFSAAENVAMPLLIQGDSYKKSIDRAVELLEAVQLSHRKNHLPGELSGGEQQRVALARSMVTAPDLILADEPTGDLDEDTGKAVLDLIHQLNREFKVSFVIATHNLSIAESADRWFKMSDGKLKLVGCAEKSMLAV